LFFSQKADNMNRKQLVAALRSALMQLDDLQNLAKSPLLTFLGTNGQEANPVMLQRLLLDTMEALREDAGVNSERYYDILYYRYQEQLNQEDVAFQLGVSIRQLRREQNNAIELLAEHIREQLGQAPEVLSSADPPDAASPFEGTEIQREIARLRHSLPTEPSQIGVEMQKVFRDAGSLLAQRYGVTFKFEGLPATHQAPLPPMVFRQALLILLAALIPQSAGKTIEISFYESVNKLGLVLRLGSERDEWIETEEFKIGLQTAAQLLAPFHSAVVQYKRKPASVIVWMPAMASTPILVIDDNPDVHQLLSRYVAHSRFRLITSSDVHQAITLAQTQSVQGLVLDIMMPEIDGWDLLSQWNHHPATQQIPVAVCTILPQQELAYVLGATLFIQKPVEQEYFLRALETLTAIHAPVHG
jgi:CheY-like chemotaxis protein